MQLLYQAARFFVGGLFIFSGLVKINDPVGTGIKMKEYFEVFEEDFASFFEVFVPFGLEIGTFIIVFEVVLGVALLTGLAMKWTLRLLMAMILFFTFLTFYSAYFKKVTDCGCFGDAIPLNPWQSFYKDIILSILIIFLNFSKKPDNKFGKIALSITVVSTVVSIFLAIYAINHLPFIDFRAYAPGNNISEGMKVPEPEEPCKYVYLLSKDGKQEKFDKIPSDYSQQGYEFDSMYVLNADLCQPEPEIKDFLISSDEGEITEEVLTGKKLWIIVHQYKKSYKPAFEEVTSMIGQLHSVMPVIISADATEEFEQMKATKMPDVLMGYGDEKVMKTVVRSSPGLVLVVEGTVVEKWHYNDIPQAAEVEEKAR